MVSADPVTKLAASVAKKTFLGLADELAATVLAAVGKQVVETYEIITSNFGPHLEATFRKCTLIRTLLNRDAPVDLLSQYVRTRFRTSGRKVEDYDVISETRASRRAVISGTAGTGKTVFMKYLWLSLFEKSEGRIPVFLELRRLNDLTSESLISYVHRTIVNTNANVSLAVFERGIKKGHFTFILDGFDEITIERRNSIEKQILALSDNYPNCIIVISTRPDDRFSSWQSFTTYHVLPLLEDQVEELIGKVNYDEKIKSKFLQRLKKGLYEKHGSFLSSPLLATMMLMTFDQFADIPEKIHLFYEQAFDTLFAKHDALKEAFKRRMYTDLPCDLFKRYFSLFSLVSYYDQKSEFSEQEIIDYIEKGLLIEKATVNKDLFLKDLMESVCIVQKDGVHFTFTHRSFQEYFSAYCLARLPAKYVGPILEKTAARSEDDMVQMLFDMNQDLIEAEYILPKLKELNRKIAEFPSENLFEEYAILLGLSFTAMYDWEVGSREKLFSFFALGSSEYYGLIEVLARLYPEALSPSPSRARRGVVFRTRDDDEILGTVFDGLRTKAKQKPKVKFMGLSMDVQRKADGQFEIRCRSRSEGTPNPKDLTWIRETRLAQQLTSQVAALRKLARSIEKRLSEKSDSIDTIFELG